MKDRIIGFSCGAGMMGVFVLLLAFCAHGQTRVRWDQLNKYSESQTKESEWCSAPNLVVVNDKQLVVGSKWTPDDPCYIHYGITPPAQVDPLSISKFTAPLYVDLNPAFTGDDEIYIWATEPKFSPVTPSKIYIGVKDVNALQCPTCAIVPQTTLPRMFPAGVVPIGFVQIVQGKLHPKAHDILDGHQIHIAGSPLIVHKKENGYFFEVNPATQTAMLHQQQLENSRTQMEVARNQATERMMKSEPVPAARLKTMQRQIEETQKLFYDLYNKLPVGKYDIAQVRSNLDSLRHEAQMIRSQVQMQIEQAYERTRMDVSARYQMGMQVPPPSDQNQACGDQQWSVDSRFYYRCVQSTDDRGGIVRYRWIRHRLDSWDEPRIAQQIKPGVPSTNE